MPTVIPTTAAMALDSQHTVLVYPRSEEEDRC